MRGRAALVALALLLTACSHGSGSPPPSTRTAGAASPSSAPSPATSPAATVESGPAPNGCDAKALTRVSPRVDRTIYTIDATVDLAANQVRGTLKARFTPDRATDHIVMRLWPNGPTPAGKGGHVALAGATLNGTPIGLSLTNPTTAIAATGPLTAGKAVRFAVAFTDAIPRHLDDRFSRVGNTVRLGSWLPLLPWEPGVGWALDPPTTSNAEASSSVHADFDVHLNTPPGATVLASGTDKGASNWSIVAAPDWAASVGDFTLARGTTKSGVPVVVGVDRAVSESPTTYLNRAVPAIDDLTERYGAYPWPSYTLAITPQLKGGIEYPGHVMQGPGTSTRTTPHEAAHQWFYALVGNDQGRDPWLDEGLATWAEAQVDNSYRAFLAKPIPAGGAGHLGEPMPYWDAHHGAYYRSVYVQTVQAIGALGVSPAAIDCALARYVAAHAYRVAVPSDAIDALTTVAPDAEAVFARFGAQRQHAT